MAGVDASAALKNAIHSLGAAMVEFGQALQVINLQVSSQQQEAGKVGKKRKSKDDPGKPKAQRFPSAYNLFVSENSSKLRATNDYSSQQDIMKALGSQWKVLSEKERKKYVQRAQDGRVKKGEAVLAPPTAADTSSDSNSSEEDEPPAPAKVVVTPEPEKKKKRKEKKAKDSEKKSKKKKTDDSDSDSS